MGVTPSRLHPLQVIKGRAVGGGLSNGCSGARAAEHGGGACGEGEVPMRSREGGVVAGARPLGGHVG